MVEDVPPHAYPLLQADKAVFYKTIVEDVPPHAYPLLQANKAVLS